MAGEAAESSMDGNTSASYTMSMHANCLHMKCPAYLPLCSERRFWLHLHSLVMDDSGVMWAHSARLSGTWTASLGVFPKCQAPLRDSSEQAPKSWDNRSPQLLWSAGAPEHIHIHLHKSNSITGTVLSMVPGGSFPPDLDHGLPAILMWTSVQRLWERVALVWKHGNEARRAWPWVSLSVHAYTDLHSNVLTQCGLASPHLISQQREVHSQAIRPLQSSWGTSFCSLFLYNSAQGGPGS